MKKCKWCKEKPNDCCHIHRINDYDLYICTLDSTTCEDGRYITCPKNPCLKCDKHIKKEITQ
jgi:hypothetical protein